MAIPYPDILPLPQQQGYALAHGPAFVRTELPGRASQRRSFAQPVTVSVNWLLTDAQAQLFEGWYAHTINDGADWFDCRLKTRTGLRAHACRFVDIYQGPALVAPGLWRVTAELELRERPT